MKLPGAIIDFFEYKILSNLNLLVKIQQKGLPWPPGAFNIKRSFCSIDNMAFVVQQLIEKDIVSNFKIKQALSVIQMPLSAQDGIIKTLESFKL